MSHFQLLRASTRRRSIATGISWCLAAMHDRAVGGATRATRQPWEGRRDLTRCAPSGGLPGWSESTVAVGDIRWKLLRRAASGFAPARQCPRGIARMASERNIDRPTETPMLLPNANGGSQLLVVVPSLPNGSQSDKHLYSTNSSADRVA